MQESIHAAWLENSLSSFQSHLFDALLAATKNSHTPLTRSSVQPQPAGNSFAKPGVDNGNSAQIKSVLVNQVGKSDAVALLISICAITKKL